MKNDRKEIEMKVPPDLRRSLASKPSADVIWKSLTPIARRDFIGWIESAKQPETRTRRVERVVPMLASGKRRPCCYAIVPMNLYRALGADQKAKSTWGTLTPDERRDIVAWIDGAKKNDERMLRIEKTCAILAAGKRGVGSKIKYAPRLMRSWRCL